MPGDTALVVRAGDAAVRIGSFGPVHIVIYVDTPTLDGLRLSHRQHLSLMAERSEPTSLLSVISAGLPLPPSSVRKLGAQLLAEVQSRISCMATVVEGSGFWASAIRSVLTGIQLVVRSPKPNRAFATIDDAAAYIGGHYPGFEVPGDLLAAAVSELRGDPAAATA
jgi:hypothetical protein